MIEETGELQPLDEHVWRHSENGSDVCFQRNGFPKFLSYDVYFNDQKPQLLESHHVTGGDDWRFPSFIDVVEFCKLTSGLMISPISY